MKKTALLLIFALLTVIQAIDLEVATADYSMNPSLCADDGVTEVPYFAEYRDSDECLWIDPGNGDPLVLFQYDTFHESGGCLTSAPALQISDDFPGYRCRTALPEDGGQYCSMVVWNVTKDNYGGQNCHGRDGMHYAPGVPLEYYLMKNVQIMNSWKCTGNEWWGPNGMYCAEGQFSDSHTDGIQLMGNPSGGGWFVMQDSALLNGYNLHFLHQQQTKWGENGNVMLQNVKSGRQSNAGFADDYIQDCFDRGNTKPYLCDEGKAMIDYCAVEYWFVDVWGTTKMRPSCSEKVVIVNTGCNEDACNGTIGYHDGWPHPLHCSGRPSGPGTCPNGGIGMCSSVTDVYCYTSLEEAAKDHKLPPFAHLSDTGWENPPSGAVCGDGVVNGSEQCDGGELGTETCVSQGFDGGDLACANCMLDTSQCTTVCGNGNCNGMEDCMTCEEDCGACPVCGDGMVNGTEECDGDDFGGQTCQGLGYDEGNLTCVSCSIDDSQCMNIVNTIFSGIEYSGDRLNYQEKTLSRWEISSESGNDMYSISTTSYSNDGDKLGEYSILQDRTYGNFTLTLQVMSDEDLSSNSFADYAAIFGWQDSENYYYMVASSDPRYSELFVVESGTRTSLGQAPSPLIQDNVWHILQVTRSGDQITVEHDGEVVIEAQDSTYLNGQVGIGSYNDAAHFDDIEVTGDPGQYHRADKNRNGCIEGDEIGDFIDKWYINSADVTMVELVRALEIWKLGDC
jgi:hypothetical protein